MIHDAIVVGGGIFGRTIARALTSRGQDVILVDDARPNSGSRPSACLMKPSWFSGLGRDVYDPALEELDRMYGVRERQFTIWPTRQVATVLWVPSARILRPSPDILELSGRVTEAGSGWVRLADGRELDALYVILATGVWTSELAPVDGLVGKMGASFTWKGRVNDVIKPWAPYKQVVVFQQDDETAWGGDGAAIKPENWTEARESAAQGRVLRACGASTPLGLHVARGIRPYVPGAKPCHLERRLDGLWIATGGAKNGTLAAGWAARELAGALS